MSRGRPRPTEVPNDLLPRRQLRYRRRSAGQPAVAPGALGRPCGQRGLLSGRDAGAGIAAGSASLQADALDFFGDAANYAVSLGVAGMALAVRARAAMAKGATLVFFAACVLGSTAWHASAGTLPEAEVMGVVGVAALAANAGVALMLYRFRGGDANMRSVWICSRKRRRGQPRRGAGRRRRVRHRHRLAGRDRGRRDGRPRAVGRLANTSGRRGASCASDAPRRWLPRSPTRARRNLGSGLLAHGFRRPIAGARGARALPSPLRVRPRRRSRARLLGWSCRQTSSSPNCSPPRRRPSPCSSPTCKYTVLVLHRNGRPAVDENLSQRST